MRSLPLLLLPAAVLLAGWGGRPAVDVDRTTAARPVDLQSVHTVPTTHVLGDDMIVAGASRHNSGLREFVGPLPALGAFSLL